MQQVHDRDTARPRGAMIRSAAFAGAVVAALAFVIGGASLPAAGDDQAFPAEVLRSLPPLSDVELDSIRGKYVPQPQASSLPVSTIEPNPLADITRSLPAAAPSAARTNVVSGLTDAGLLAGGGQVVYFGIELVSQWQSTGQNQGRLSAGAALGVNLGDPQRPQLSGVQWTSAQGESMPGSTANGNTVNGAPLANLGGGIGQSIQVAGNGNAVVNQAQIDIGSSPPTLPVPTPNGNPCTPACNTTMGASGMGVSITVPGGTIAQTVGPNGILQSAQIRSDLNQITNSLIMRVQVAPASGLNVGQLSTVLQGMQGLPRGAVP